MAYQDIASDLSYQVLQRRRGLGELDTPTLHEVYRRPYAKRINREAVPVVNDVTDAPMPNPPSVALGAREGER